LLRAVAPRYRYCSGATFKVAVAVAPLLFIEKNGDGSAATFSRDFWRYALLLRGLFIHSILHSYRRPYRQRGQYLATKTMEIRHTD